MTAEKQIGAIRFILAARRGVKSRPVNKQLLVKCLSIPIGKKGVDNGTLKVSCLVASEIDPPKGAKPVQCRLLTNRRVDTLAEASELIDWYRARWEIEMFFNIQKSLQDRRAASEDDAKTGGSHRVVHGGRLAQ